MSDIFATIAAVGMAVGPPLVYADQAISIIRKKDSTGFSHDVCGVLLVANIIRIYFWLGNRFELPLLVQSILLIISQLLLLSICLHYRPLSSPTIDYAPLSPMFDADTSADHRTEGDTRDSAQRPLQPSSSSSSGPSRGNRRAKWAASFRSGIGLHDHGHRGKGGKRRPWNFWQWDGIGSYLEFLAALILIMGVLQLALGRFMWYVDTIGFIALAIESTLPVPQFISNYKRKSCYGFRSSTLAGWLFGDTFKTGYFFIRNAPTQFKVTAIMTVCWDVAVLVQRVVYKAEPPISARGMGAEGEGEGDEGEGEGQGGGEEERMGSRYEDERR